LELDSDCFEVPSKEILNIGQVLRAENQIVVFEEQVLTKVVPPLLLEDVVVETDPSN